jgi:hypothetical protein
MDVAGTTMSVLAAPIDVVMLAAVLMQPAKNRTNFT